MPTEHPLNISPQDKPISITNDPINPELPFVIHDVHGTERARFKVQEDAQAYGDAVNFPQPELMQEGMHDTGTARAEEPRAKPKGRTMPRGIPKKKKTGKKAASVKKAVQKTMKRRKKRKA